MPPPATPDFVGVLAQLRHHAVDFIVVGGVGAVLQGAPVVTFDLDIVPARDAANLDRLFGVLGSLDATYRDPAGRKIAPRREDLGTAGHHLLTTALGFLDVLGAIGPDLAYSELLPHTAVVRLESDVEIRVLSLEKLIEIKERLGRAKDLAVVPVLRRTLEESRKG